MEQVKVVVLFPDIFLFTFKTHLILLLNVSALMASKLNSVDCGREVEPKLHDVVPLSLGVAKIGNIMDVILPRNSRVPCSKTRIYSTSEDNQPGVTIEVGKAASKKLKRIIHYTTHKK